jgi:hypothetical protein
MLSFVLHDVVVSKSSDPFAVADALHKSLLTLADAQRRDRDGETLDGFTDEMLEELRGIDFTKVEVKLARVESGHLVAFIR